MKTKDKLHFLTEYISAIKSFFFVAIFLIFLFGLVSFLIFPDERDTLNTDCRVFEATWEQVLVNGEHVTIEVPGKVTAEWGEVITVTTTLPLNIHTGENLCFRPIWQDVSIYVDGELRQSYTTKDSRPFGINSPMRYIFVELQETDAGKELTYQFSSHSKYAGDIRTVYIGDRLSIWTHLVEESGIRTIIAIFLFLMSLFCIMVCVILKFVYKKTLSLIYLAWTIFFCAFWMLSEVEFRQIIFKNISVLSCYAYWSLMVIPFPLLLYINDIQNNRYKKVFLVPLSYSAIMFTVGTFLQLFDIAQFVHEVPFIHIGLLMSILCVIVTITIDTFTGKITDYLAVGIGIYGMMLTAIVEMIFYYIGSSLSMGTILAIGLFFLLIMAIIKTGQDLFRSEKKRQQAIMAREAQAKFLANMSHEIRTPLNAIIGMNEMILRENDDETTLDYAQSIRSASKMLLGLVNDVLDFSKIESGQLDLVEDTYRLDSLLKDEILLLEARTAEKPIIPQIIIAPDLPTALLGDELRIKQILTNLISNAAKYTKQGSVTLRAFYDKKDASHIQLCFSVIDTGIGIKQEDLAQLFDSFKRLELNKNRTIQGTGLGLNIAKQLVDLMGGTITVQSTYGSGSTFTVSIPQEIIDNTPLGNLDMSLHQAQQGNEYKKGLFSAPNASVLVVDDNSMNLSLMNGLLKRTKMKVDTASSGEKCLELTRKKKYDIIFLDHMMPELDGVETLNILRSEASNLNRNTTVIVLTANAIAGCREEYLSYGFNDYFPKPIETDKLETLLLQYLPKELVELNQSKEQPAPPAEEKNTSSKPPANLLDIDTHAGISYCLNSEEFYREMLENFCSQIDEYLPQLDNCIKNCDWINYGIITHGIKTNSRTIGAVNFAELSLQHEQAGKAENSEFINAEYPAYLNTLNELIKKIQGML